MIINSSDITLAAAHSKVQVHEKSEALTVVTGAVTPQQEGDGDRISLTGEARDLSDKYEGSSEIRKIRVGHHRGRKLGLIKNLLEELTGEKIKIKDLRHWMGKIQDHDDNDDDHDGNDKHKKTHKHDHHRNQMAWGINYTMSETHYERQDLNFNAGGVVRTADGREINFSLDLMMSREYMSQQDVSFTAAGIGSTPVIVDFQGPASELTNAEFNFGVEGEGESETVSYLSLGNGLLSLDMNNDSTITSTNELFGPATGNGFAELAAYDQDGNNWIDENDTVFSQLQLWSRDAEGNAVLNGLLDQNVGAIYLGNVDTPFDLKDSQNTLLGQVEKSGVYLSEDGTPGTIQQLSLIV